jgi:enoyl-[acyl-carrier protein] reductase I
MNIFETNFRRGKFDESRKLSNGKLMEFAHIYPMDAVFDTPEDVPEEVRGIRSAAGSKTAAAASSHLLLVMHSLRYPRVQY